MKQQELQELLEYYQRLGAPTDQQTLISLLREVQQEEGGSITTQTINEIRKYYKLAPSLLNALVRRIPGLRISESCHLLELCGGPNCGKRQSAQLLSWLERTYGAEPGKKSRNGCFILQLCPCMRQCGKGPNLKWDGRLYNEATEQLLRDLIEKKP